MVFGAGMNYRLSEHWALRAEYRGLVRENPDFGNAYALPIFRFIATTNVTNEPTISIVYRFSGKR
jgi:opacity protein-like surface antigen